jgi:hypothetical protein
LAFDSRQGLRIFLQRFVTFAYLEMQLAGMASIFRLREKPPAPARRVWFSHSVLLKNFSQRALASGASLGKSE